MSEKVLRPEALRPEVGVVVGTRPGIVMFAPIIACLRKKAGAHFMIHTGQHYSPNMDAQFFSDLELPAPDYRLEGVSEKPTHGGQTAAMLEGVERILLERKPRLVLVGGDANTNLAGALAARKLGIGVGHVEAGERSYDWSMPEEHNRRIIDHISEYLFTSSPKAGQQLERESVRGKIIETGNPIVDASRAHLDLALRRFGQPDRRDRDTGHPYAILTTHREENVDDPVRLRGIFTGVARVAQVLDLTVLCLAHPRTLKRLREFGLEEWAHTLDRVEIRPGSGYLEFLALLSRAALILTDSGGVQQEACIHRVPCVTLRENTEWVETIEIGANRLVGTDPDQILAGASEALHARVDWKVPFGDGHAAERIVDCALGVIGES